jgi:glycerol-3-phosphate acyltransferase PlsX
MAWQAEPFAAHRMMSAEQISPEAPYATLALDVHGGDHGLEVSLPAAAQALQTDPKLHIILVGQQAAIESAVSAAGMSLGARLSLRHAPDILAMDAKPMAVLRRGHSSSMRLALQLVAEGEAGACVSSGSTAALMTLGVKIIGMLPGIQRPALMAHVPVAHGRTGMLDLGANLNVSAHQLVQFAVMGSVTAQLADGIDQPRVGLLNVGHEDGKGHEVVRDAHQQLKALPLNYIGFIEGHDIFSGQVDVAVCDGFVGNVMLKSSEGLASLLHTELRQALDSNTRSRLGAWLAGPALRRMLAWLDPSAHNGAPLLGLNGVVVKSHGRVDSKALTRAILEAGREARRRVPEKIETSIRTFHLETKV